MKLTKDGQIRLYGNVEYRARALCPNGTYVGGGAQCALTPEGGYVPASPSPPQLAPDGTWHSGGGRVILCPDGTYVTGNHCVLTPSGEYVGSN